MTGLKVVCLISGGKDSLFSILHCLANGHEIVALANLHPPYVKGHATPDDLDSYMYQTVGHTFIPLFEKALGLPLYRQAILGTAKNQDKSYYPAALSDNDETEALTPLLRKVKERHPEINAVNTGAILSDYQRTRVESVALRLGLTPLSYLWQYPFLHPFTPTNLLEDMNAVGQDSRIIKIASGGLDDSFLWQNVANSRTIARLDKASKLFGAADDGAVLGEGGEYETLAISGPAPLWKGRIVVDHDQREISTGEAGSASVRVLGAHVELEKGNIGTVTDVRLPALLECRFQAVLDSFQGHEYGTSTAANGSNNSVYNSHNSLASTDGANPNVLSLWDTHLLLSNLVGAGKNAAEQMRSIMEQAQSKLLAVGKSFKDVAYTSIILRDMAAFPAINAGYGAYLTHPNPPARATIACADVLSPEHHLMVSFTYVDGADSRLSRGLHVQSRSYWAPANIGPYSQAVSVATKGNEADAEFEVVYVAGQIPLVPASMELAQSLTDDALGSFVLQSVLALQHAARIARITRIKQWIGALVFITAETPEMASTRSKIAHHVWHTVHHPDEAESSDIEVHDDSFDIWDATHGPSSSRTQWRPSSQDRSSYLTYPLTNPPKLSVLRVDTLPRNASIEWVLYGSMTELNSLCHVPHHEHLLSIFRDRIVSPA